MSISMKDIAQALNLSLTTVSWVLSGNGDERKISSRTQERVKNYAKKHNYQANLLAKSLTCGSTNTIGLVVPSIADEFYAQIARHIELEAEKYGYTLAFCSSETDTGRESKIIRMLKAKGVDGLIIAPTKDSEPEIKMLMDESYPFILIDRFFPKLDTNYIIVNNEEGSFCLVEQLIKTGKRKIALVTTATDLLNMRMRTDGYKKALVNTGLPEDPNLIIDVAHSDYEQEIVSAFDRLFQLVPDVDGFYFTTHFLALEGLRYFHNNEIDIDDRIGLACFHTNLSFSILAPQMFIALQPINEISQKAVDILINNIQDKNTSTTQLVLSTISEF